MANLVLPTWCPGCGQPGRPLCRGCATELNWWFRAEYAADALEERVRVWACGAYLDRARAIILSWKSGRRPDLAVPIARLGERSGRRLAPILAEYPQILVVPAPSGWRRRWRGNEVVAPLAGAVTRGLVAAGVDARTVEILRRRGGGNHLLDRRQRALERAASISLRPGRALAAVAATSGEVGILLVDDVLTTGATLAASAAALAEIGEVAGAIVLAATPKPVH